MKENELQNLKNGDAILIIEVGRFKEICYFAGRCGLLSIEVSSVLHKGRIWKNGLHCILLSDIKKIKKVKL